MFIDTNRCDHDSVAVDIAIIGTGACGLAMADSLIGSGVTVAMLETGSFERTDPAEALTRAEVRGTFPVWIRSRSRFLGGSTNCWGGNNSPLDPVDFERDWVPQARWPIGLDDIMPYAEPVHDLLHLGPVDFSVEFWKHRLDRVRDGLWFDGSGRVTTKLIQRTAVGHLGQSMERPLDDSDDLTVYLNAQVVNIDTTPDGSSVTGVDAVSLDRSRRLRVTADRYVIAAGPENPRLLLASRNQHPDGIGNEFGQVGKWWISHLSSLRGWIEPSRELDWSLYDLTERPIGEMRIFGALQVAESVQRERRILNGAAILEPFRAHAGFNNRARAVAAIKGRLHRDADSLEIQDIDADLVAGTARDVARVVTRTATDTLRKRRGRPARIMVRNWCEQYPHPDNRVELADVADEFGVPRMRIISNLQPEDRVALRQTFEIIGSEFEEYGYGRWQADFPEGDSWPAGAINTAHFMGGTRMAEKPEDGVVDTECRVHGVDNLYIAGASVFPTAGVSMVTYTAVLLAVRLAEHLSGRAGRDEVPVLRTAPQPPTELSA